jgi:hypothetical protein
MSTATLPPAIKELRRENRENKAIADLGMLATLAELGDQADLDAYREALSKRAERRSWLSPDELAWRRYETAAQACGVNPHTGTPYYTADDFALMFWRAERMGARRPRLGDDTVDRLFRAELVPNLRLGARVEELLALDLICLKQIADAIPADMPGHGDVAYLGRILGLNSAKERGGLGLRLFLDYDVACAIARACGIDFQEVGL